MPWAQLLAVPLQVRPLLVLPVAVEPVAVMLNSTVFISAWPAAGPDTVIGVLAVRRRPSGELFTTLHLPLRRRNSAMDTPCAACDLRHLSMV